MVHGETISAPHHFIYRNSFQQHIRWKKEAGGLVMVDSTLMPRLQGTVYRYATCVEAESLVGNNHWWFDKPTNWQDKYEKHVAKSLFDDGAPLDNMILYAKCFTFQHSSEPLWRLQQDRVRIRFKLRDLIDSLGRARRLDGGPLPKLYIGRARYMDPWIIRRAIEDLKQGQQPAKSTLAAAALLMKRLGFNYENEIRACFVFKKGTIDKDVLKIEVAANAIDEMMINPYADDETELDLRDRFEDRVREVKKSQFDLVRGHE
jgi:hypothetical protein